MILLPGGMATLLAFWAMEMLTLFGYAAQRHSDIVALLDDVVWLGHGVVSDINFYAVRFKGRYSSS